MRNERWLKRRTKAKRSRWGHDDCGRVCAIRGLPLVHVRGEWAGYEVIMNKIGLHSLGVPSVNLGHPAVLKVCDVDAQAVRDVRARVGPGVCAKSGYFALG